jgi:uncharacterized protein (DUF952 family)
MTEKIMFKILREQEWKNALETGIIEVEVDRIDGYIHFSTSFQISDTLNKWFQDVVQVRVLAFSAEKFATSLKWEKARGGDLFPHVYGVVPTHEF